MTEKDWDHIYEMAHKEFNKQCEEHRNAVIEECARVADEWLVSGVSSKPVGEIIRKLKDVK